jgi:AbrB family looped-hinge helix DNA binding protein
MRITATITEKGQVTIPKAIRTRIKGRVIEFVVKDDRIEILPVQSVEGVLAEYAPSYTPLETVRELVWGTNEPS